MAAPARAPRVPRGNRGEGVKFLPTAWDPRSRHASHGCARVSGCVVPRGGLLWTGRLSRPVGGYGNFCSQYTDSRLHDRGGRACRLCRTRCTHASRTPCCCRDHTLQLAATPVHHPLPPRHGRGRAAHGPSASRTCSPETNARFVIVAALVVVAWSSLAIAYGTAILLP